MDAERYFREMYACIWQSQDLGRFDEFYAKDFCESIDVTDPRGQPKELSLDYTQLKQAAQWQADTYQDTTFEIKKLVATSDCYLSVHFYSTSVVKISGELRYRQVCGIWRLNSQKQIDRVWAVVTPYYED
jgi:hypothetical protein